MATHIEEPAEEPACDWCAYVSDHPDSVYRNLTREGAEDFAAANPGWIASTNTNYDLVVAADFP